LVSIEGKVRYKEKEGAMSGLELVAGIAGVAAAAIKVSVAMNDLAEELGSAGRDVRYIGNDMAGFAQVGDHTRQFSCTRMSDQGLTHTDHRQVLRLVQSSLEEGIKAAGSTVIQSVFDTLPQLVEQCTMVYDEANGLMVALKGTTGKDSSISFFQRMKFVFYKGRITILRSLLDSSKSTLNLLLVTLNIEMAKSKIPDKGLMDQLQNERKAFIRVVHSQNKALDEAMKEVEKARKEAAKFKSKRDKEKEKEKEKEESHEDADLFPKRNSTPYAYRPPPPYALHSTPSVSQLVYQPPSLERFNSVRKSSNAVTTLALSLEPVKVAGDDGASAAYTAFKSSTSQTSSQPQLNTKTAPEPSSRDPNIGINGEDHNNTARPVYPGKRVFSDPGPGQSNATFNEHLSPGFAPRERSRSPYGFSRVPQDDIPKVERKRPAFQSFSDSANPANPAQFNHRNFSTPAYGTNNMGAVPEETEPVPTTPRSTTAPPDTDRRKSSFTYYPPPPPPPPVYTEPSPQPTTVPPPPPSPKSTPPKPSLPPPPPPRHGTTYIVHTPYLTHEIGHLSLVPFDTLVDVVAHVPEATDLPYPTAYDAPVKHFWQASLGNRRGPRGLFPCDVVCPAGDQRITEKLQERENWFAGEGVGFIADVVGRCWVGPGWEWREPERRRSKWWAEEF
jgi:hypothetical protein